MMDFQKQVKVPAEVLVSEMDGEAVLLQVRRGHYFGLNAMGFQMWKVLAGAPSIQAAYLTLLADYEVEPERLREDVEVFIAQLSEAGLLEVVDVS